MAKFINCLMTELHFPLFIIGKYLQKGIFYFAEITNTENNLIYMFCLSQLKLTCIRNDQ